MPDFCSGNLLRSRQRKSFDVVNEELSLMIKGKASQSLFDQGFSGFVLDPTGRHKTFLLVDGPLYSNYITAHVAITGRVTL